MQHNIIATAPTEERLLNLAKRFWLSDAIKFEGEQVYNSKGIIAGVKVQHKGKRFRLVSEGV